MTPAVLPAMNSLHSLRHVERDVRGLFFADNLAMINQVNALRDRSGVTWHKSMKINVIYTNLTDVNNKRVPKSS